MTQVFVFSLATVLASAGLVIGQDVLEPVVVTAKRLEDETRFSATDLEVYQIDRVQDLLGTVPGLTSVDSDSAGYGNTLGVRGTTNTLFFSPAGVGMMIDDVPLGDVFTYPVNFFQLDEAQLLRGPQGTRFGRNGAAGMFVLRTAEVPEAFEGELEVEYGSYDGDEKYPSKAVHLRLGGPLSEHWSASWESFYREREGFIRNVTLGRRTDDRESFGNLAKLVYRPSADFEARLRFMHERVRDGSQRLVALPGQPSPFGPGIGMARALGRQVVASDLAGQTDLDRAQLSLHLKQEFDWGTLHSITAYQEWELDPSTVDLDLTAVQVTGFPGPSSASFIEQEQKLLSQEFRFSSAKEQSTRWQGGLFAWRKDSDGAAVRTFQVPMGMTIFDVEEATLFDQREDRLAFFGHLEQDLGETLTVDGGLRLEYVDAEISRSKAGSFGPGLSFAGRSSEWLFSPSLGLTWRASDQVTLFARSAIGMKPGGFTAFSDQIETVSFDRERSWENELGVRFGDEESWQVELRGYLKKIDEYQVNRSVPFTTDFIIQNAERVTAWGLEAEAFWKPSEASVVRAGAGWNSTEFDRYLLEPGVRVDGNTVPFVPEFTASLSGRYRFDSGFYLQAAVKWVGETYFESENAEAYREGSYWLANAEVGYEADRWSVAVFGRNIFDKDYFTFINSQINAGTPGDPALVGMRGTVSF